MIQASKIMLRGNEKYDSSFDERLYTSHQKAFSSANP